jgi:hypothetical protein
VHNFFRPLAIRSGREFEDETVVEGASIRRRTINIPSLIKHEGAVGKDSANVAGKVVQDLLRPGSVRASHEFENQSEPVRAAAGGAVEVAVTVEHHAIEGIPASAAAGEVIEHRLGPRAVLLRRKFENGPVESVAAAIGSPIEVPLAVEGQATLGSESIGKAIERAKAVENILRPGSIGAFDQFEDGTAAAAKRTRSTGAGGAVKVAIAVGNESAVWIAAIAASGESVQDGFSLGHSRHSQIDRQSG